MAKDRLAGLKPLAGDDDIIPDIFSQTNIVVEDEEHEIEKLFDQVEEVHATIAQIEENVAKVKSKHGEILADPNNDNRLKEELSDLMSEIKRGANKTRAFLQSMKKELEDEDSANAPNNFYRIRQTQSNTLSKKFVNVMNEYNECQVTYRQKCKERIQRQLAIAGRATSDEELEDMIESGNPQIFNQGIVMETQAAKKTLADIEARHEDIMKLENSIRELHDMFMDMAMLVESQGEMIDRIEFNVNQAQIFVVEAKNNTEKALKYKSSARRKKICLISVLVLVIVVVLIAIIVPVVIQSMADKNNGHSDNNPLPAATPSAPPERHSFPNRTPRLPVDHTQ
ncbi:syntaxin-like [Watersipora subatra]|uniref:syntaxin-like n=1 Tax=Watersipora subatra TaxID=2589382 RepID=UPI00355B619C